MGRQLKDTVLLAAISGILLSLANGFVSKYGGRLGSSSLRVSSFDLESYVATELLDDKSSPVIEPISQLGIVSDFDEAKFSHVMLVDIGVREIDSLRDSSTIPGVKKFLHKLETDKKGMLEDKFMYTYDVGTENECKMIMTRVPEKAYMKLDLAKQIIGSIKSSNVFVSMVGEYGDIKMDRDMVAALYSAWQARDFKMPDMKTTASIVGKTKKTRGDVQRGRLLILEPNKPLQLESNVEDEIETANADDSLENWHYFKDLSDEERNERRKRVKELEAALLSGTKSTEDNLKAKRSMPRAEESSHLSFLFKDSPVFESNASSVSENVAKLRHVNHGTNIARSLSSLPPNVLNPCSYTGVVRTFAEKMNWEISEWTPLELRDMGCGGFCAVAKGNPVSDKDCESSDRLIRLKYSPSLSADDSDAKVKKLNSAVNLGDILRRNNDDETPINPGIFESDDDKIKIKTPIVLCGKGVTYDTGGINLKSANSMKTMKGDMAGSAAAIGVMYALTKLNVRIPIECWLAIVENNSGPESFRPDDVISVVTGESVEIVNTDAEGRLVLADVLALASRKVRKSKVHGFSDTMSPRCIVDFATLTGTCISSLSNRYIGVMSNREESMSDIITGGVACGERLWPFPVDEDFGEDLKSDVADYLQCRQPIEADHIYAAHFLKQFVNPAVPWFHLDMGSSYRSTGLGHVGTDFTGCGVRSSISLLEHYL